MQFSEYNPNEKNEGLDKIAQISVIQEFDIYKRVAISKELAAALQATDEPDVLDGCDIEVEQAGGDDPKGGS